MTDDADIDDAGFEDTGAEETFAKDAAALSFELEWGEVESDSWLCNVELVVGVLAPVGSSDVAEVVS